MIINISIIIRSIMTINIPCSISKRIIASVRPEICKMLLRQIIRSKPLRKKRCLHKRGHSKCPAHSIWILIFYRSYISLFCCIIVRRIRRCSSHRNLTRIISDLNGCGIGRQAVKRCQLFLLFLFCQRSSFNIFNSGVFTVKFSLSVTEWISLFQ